MLRLTLMLSCAIYAGLVVYGEGQGDASGTAAVDASRGVTEVAPPLARAVRDDRMTTEDGRILEFAAVINPTSLNDGSDRVTAVSTVVAPEIVTASASAPSPELPRVAVIGSQVNLRAGPSTNDTVLGSLVRGDEAELIASLGNGWAQIRSVSTGIEGFMADRFLAPVN